MTIVYITRHGETEWNRQKRFQGNKNSNLTEKGIEAAKKLSKRAETIDVDFIISSPLKRAYETAEIVRGNKNVEIVTYDGLKEVNLGDFEGLTYKEIEEKFNDTLKKINADPVNNKYPNGESLKEFFERVSSTFEKILEEYKDKRIMVVAHGGTVKAIECWFRHVDIKKDWMGTVVENCSLSCIEVKADGEIKEIFYNDTEHLK